MLEEKEGRGEEKRKGRRREGGRRRRGRWGRGRGEEDKPPRCASQVQGQAAWQSAPRPAPSASPLPFPEVPHCPKLPSFHFLQSQKQTMGKPCALITDCQLLWGQLWCELA